MITKVAQKAVTHIYVYDYRDTGYEWVDQIYKPNWLDRLFGSKEEDISAYYKNGKVNSTYFQYSKEEVKKDSSWVDIDGKLFCKPCIKIFVGSERIKIKYFNSLQDAIKFCNKNFPEVNIVV